MASCALCEDELSGPGQRTCGVELCWACYGGDLRERLRPRGFVIEEKTWTSSPSSADGQIIYNTRVTGVVAIHSVPRAIFSRESLGTKLVKFFGRHEIQVGDSLFDDAIWVDTDTPEITAHLLRHEGLQSVVLDAVHELGALQLQPVPGGCQASVFTTHSSGAQLPPATGHQRTIALALLHLQAAASTS